MTQTNPNHQLLGYLGKATAFGREVNVDPDTPLQVNVAGPTDPDGNVLVNIQNQHTAALDLDFLKVLAAPTTITVATSPEDRTITIANTTGFVDGVMVAMASADVGAKPYFSRQIGAVSGNVVTLAAPIDSAYPVGAVVFPASTDMNVNGSSTVQVFRIGPIGGVVDVDITRIMGYIEDNMDMDDAKFGGIDALTRGVQLRINNTIITNLWNVRTNAEIALICFSADYSDRAPAGYYGFRFRSTYAGSETHGVALRLYAGDALEILIQDDLTDLHGFRMMAQGHIVLDAY
ncbi:MAG: hypothetical protein KAS32_19215 [Candidatus Peribacteraceae bacterium]|nr:hypothetical protein [Candidatus Peribacteraceae bacterium]